MCQLGKLDYLTGRCYAGRKLTPTLTPPHANLGLRHLGPEITLKLAHIARGGESFKSAGLKERQIS